MAPKNNANKAGANGGGAAFTLSEANKTLLREIDTASNAGNTRFVSKAEGGELVANGYIEINTANLDNAGNAAARLTDKGRKEIPPMTTPDNTGTPGAAPAVSFKIVTTAALPAIARSGGGGAGREAKYPVADIPEGGALFIALPPEKRNEASVKQASKQFGSLVADKNKKFPDRYFTSRSVVDGKEAGFGDEYAGVPGIGIYRRPVTERKVRKPRATAATTGTEGNAA